MPDLYGTGRNSAISTQRLICEDCATKKSVPIFNTYYLKAACVYCHQVKPVAMVDEDAYLARRLQEILGKVDVSTDYLERVLREADTQGLSQNEELSELLGDIRRVLRRRSL